MYRLLTLVVLAAFMVVGCSQEQSATDGASQPSGNSGNAQPMEYGSDPYFDGLYDRCEGGDAAACEALYLESPVGSEYETFAIEQGGNDFSSEEDTPPSGAETTAAEQSENASLAVGDTAELAGPYEGVFLTLDQVFVASNISPADYGNISEDSVIVVAQMSAINDTDAEIGGGFALSFYTQSGRSLSQVIPVTSSATPREFEELESDFRAGAEMTGTYLTAALPEDELILEYSPADAQSSPAASWELGPVSEMPRMEYPGAS